jgi:hypothetical protein
MSVEARLDLIASRFDFDCNSCGPLPCVGQARMALRSGLGS